MNNLKKLRPLADEVKRHIRSFTREGGAAGFLFFAWQLASYAGSFTETKAGLLRGPHPIKNKKNRKKAIGYLKGLLELNILVGQDAGEQVQQLFSKTTRDGLQGLLDLLEGRFVIAEHEDISSRRAPKAKNYGRHYFYGAMFPYMEAARIGNLTWRHRWLGKWCALVEPISIHWKGIEEEKLFRGSGVEIDTLIRSISGYDT
ncbi:MAG: hypothetical protein ABIJ96_12570, partial [Elusimicrobiota bacterium]